jgi:hypothetical protein
MPRPKAEQLVNVASLEKNFTIRLHLKRNPTRRVRALVETQSERSVSECFAKLPPYAKRRGIVARSSLEARLAPILLRRFDIRQVKD